MLYPHRIRKLSASMTVIEPPPFLFSFLSFPPTPPVAFFLIWILKLSVPLLFVVIFILGQVAMSCYYHCRRATCCDERRSKCWSRLPKVGWGGRGRGRERAGREGACFVSWLDVPRCAQV